MPRPPQNVRVWRLEAVLELDDAVRESGVVPEVSEVASALALAKPSATAIRRYIARRHGAIFPVRTTQLAPVVPTAPSNLTPAERAIFEVLAHAETPLPAANIYAQAFGYTPDTHSADTGRVHIGRIRAKGVAIDKQYGVGYWLAEKAVGA